GGGGGGGEPRRGFSLPRGVAAWRRLGALALRRWAQCPGRARSPRGAAARPGLRGTGPVGTSRAPVGSCEPGLALAEDGEGEQERQEVGMRTAQPDQEQVDARTLLGAALAQQNDARGHWARAALLHGNH
ncbi:unnamed protein product, partial [Prorocentrum cordatum]